MITSTNWLPHRAQPLAELPAQAPPTTEIHSKALETLHKWSVVALTQAFNYGILAPIEDTGRRQPMILGITGYF
jgi:hypothetical protein